MAIRKEIKLRPARSEDATGIAAIQRELGWFDHLKRETLEQSAERVRRHLALCDADDSHLVFVGATPEEDIAAYIAVHWLPYLMLRGPEGFVSELFVRAADRGHGVGTALLALVEAEARMRGCSRLNLLNGKMGEAYARGFYKRLGWEERDWLANMILDLRGEGQGG